MSTGKYVIGVDSGTQGAKVIVVDPAGNIVSEGAAAHEPMIQLSPGWAEQHPEDNWTKFCQACQEAMANLPVPKSELAAIGLTGQRGTTALLDPDGKPIRPLVVWMDPRCMYWAKWIRDNEPESYEKTYKISSVEGWIVKHLTGEFHDCAAYPPAGPGLVTSLTWPDDPAAYETYGMDREKLMDIVLPGTVYGGITRATAEATGLPEGLPVVAGAGDKQCEVLGAGAIGTGEVYVSYGTLACVNTFCYTKQAPVPKGGEYYTMGAAVPGGWNLEASLRGHLMVSWLRDEFAYDAVLEAQKRGVSPEQILNEGAAKVPPGAEALVLFPYWDARTAAPEASGLILGFYDGVHKRAHIFRAILEGIAYGLRTHLDAFARDTGRPVQEATAGGGGSKSDIGMQATADIFGVPCKRPHTPETCALGAAISGAVGGGVYSSFEEATKHMTRSERVFEPIPENVELYNAIYEGVFIEIYPALEKVFKRLNEIRALPMFREGADWGKADKRHLEEQ